LPDDPLISVIIATHDRLQLLLDCVASVCKGPNPSFEVLVVDQDASGQAGAALQARFLHGEPIRYFVLPNAGASRARNLGLKHSRGDVVAFIDDDALAGDGWLTAVHHAFFNRGPDVQLVTGRIRPIWPSTRPNWLPREREFLLGLYNIGDSFCEMPPLDQPVSANMAGRRELFMSLGGLEERLGPNYFRKRPMITGEDTLLGLRAREAGYSLFYEPNMVVYHRISTKKVKRSHFLWRQFWEGVTVVEEMAITKGFDARIQPHGKSHAREIVDSAARFLLPRFRNNYDFPSEEIRMLALCRACFSMGVIYGLNTVKLEDARAKPKCA
jgi:glucosyl-dolichyl phosphate glucuronosyltransferase